MTFRQLSRLAEARRRPRLAEARRSSLATLTLSLTFSLVACGDAAKPAATPIAPPPAEAPDAAVAALPPDAGPSVAAGLPAGVPETPAGHQLAWVLASFTRPPTDLDVAPHFTPDFTSQIPIAQILALFGKLGSDLAPIAIDRLEPGATPVRLVAVAHSEKPGSAMGGQKMQIALVVEDGEPHRIAGLTFRPLIEAKPAASWDEVQIGLRAVAPSVNFLAAEIVAGKCVPISSIEPKKALALGSASKLYLLETAAKQIAAGKHKWEETIAIDDAKKSLPPGDLRNETAGKTFTIEQLLERMVSASDNTATDHLLAFVGRQAVEDTVRASGNAGAGRNVPFLSTRDVFALKLLGSPDDLRGYAAADVAHKRKTLATFEQRDLSAALHDGQANTWDKPRAIDSIEWFASPEDLCKLVVSLKTHADAPPTADIGAILSRNPGLPDDAGAYKYIGFKGGSEPGVMNLTWLLQRKSDDKWLFLTAGFNDPASVIDDTKAITAVRAARDFLAK